MTWDDRHYDHVEHVVEEEGYGDGNEDKPPLVLWLLQGVPPFLTDLYKMVIERPGYLLKGELLELRIAVVTLLISITSCWIKVVVLSKVSPDGRL